MRVCTDLHWRGLLAWCRSQAAMTRSDSSLHCKSCTQQHDHSFHSRHLCISTLISSTHWHSRDITAGHNHVGQPVRSQLNCSSSVYHFNHTHPQCDGSLTSLIHCTKQNNVLTTHSAHQNNNTNRTDLTIDRKIYIIFTTHALDFCIFNSTLQ